MGSKKSEKASHFLEDLAMGGTAGAISKSAAAPIECVKLMLQTQGEGLASGQLATPYKGIIDAGRRAVAEEGVLSLWRGNGTNVLRYFPTQALNFAFKDSIKAHLSFKKSDGFGKWVAGNITSGAAAGAASSVFVYSLDYARTRLSADSKNARTGGGRQFKGLLDVYKQTLAADGVAGLYRGFVPSLYGICVYRGFCFGLYDTAKDTLLVGSLQNNFFASFLVGWAVTIGAGLASYPFDTVRRRAMMLVGSGADLGHNTGMMNSFTSIVKGRLRHPVLGRGCKYLEGRCWRGSVSLSRGVLSLYDVFQRMAFGKVYSAGSG